MLEHINNTMFECHIIIILSSCLCLNRLNCLQYTKHMQIYVLLLKLLIKVVLILQKIVMIISNNNYF